MFDASVVYFWRKIIIEIKKRLQKTEEIVFCNHIERKKKEEQQPKEYANQYNSFL